MKRRMATLAIVGAMAVAAMAPSTVFAAVTGTGTSKVAYQHGGIPFDSTTSVIIPKDVQFTSTRTSISNYRVHIEVYNPATGRFEAPDGTDLVIGSNKEVYVGAKSANSTDGTGTDFRLANGTNYLSYTYTVGSTPLQSGKSMGAFTDADGGTYEFNGTLQLGSTAGAVDGTYADTITFTVGSTVGDVVGAPTQG